MTTLICPFIAGPAIKEPSQFYGRQDELQQLSNRIGGISPQSVSVVGPRRVGKSSLLWQVVSRANLPTISSYRLFHTSHHYEVFYLDLSSPICKNNVSIMEKLRRDLQRAKLPTWDKSDNGDISTLCYTLDELYYNYPEIRLVLCLDEFEAINDHSTEFDNLLEALYAEAYSQHVALVTASRTSLRKLCKQRLSKFYDIFIECNLAPFTQFEWHSLVQAYLPEIRSSDLAFIERCSYNGHPLLTQLAATLLWQYPTVNEAILEQKFKQAAKDHLTELAIQHKTKRLAHANSLNHDQLIIWLYDNFYHIYKRLTHRSQHEDILRWLRE